MAIAEDFLYLSRAREGGYVRGTCLEIGSLNHQGGAYGNCKATVVSWGHDYEGADLLPGTDVDHVVDFTDGEAVRRVFGTRCYETLLLFNVVEHVYDPVRFLGNALTLLEPGGSAIISSPIVWELHAYPRDYWRASPDFYEEFARRNDLLLPDDLFLYLFRGQLRRVGDFRDAAGGRLLPSLVTGAVAYGRLRSLYSRIVHRAFDTLGRGHPFTWTSLACVLVKPRGASRRS